VPSRARARKKSQRSKSAKTARDNRTVLLRCLPVIDPRMRLMKCMEWGMSMAALMRRPMSVSKASKGTLRSAIIECISDDQAVCLSTGRLTVNARVLTSQPRTMAISLGPPSFRSLSRARNAVRGIGSETDSSRLRRWMASGTAAGARAVFTGVSRKRVVMSLTKQSALPSGQEGGSRAIGRAAPKGVSMGRYTGWGTRCWSGLWQRTGDQSSHKRRSLARSVVSSETVHQACGQPDPPKERRSWTWARAS
jgi:hypothetical protein